MRITIIGASGLIGGRLSERLRDGGHEVVAASRSTGVDAYNGEGLDLTASDAVVDVLNAPGYDTAVDFFTTTSRRIAEAAARAGVAHHVVLSIVGVDRVPGHPYYEAKVAQERESAAGPTPVTIVRATQFHEFAGTNIIPLLPEGPARIGTEPVQTVAADDVVSLLVEVVEAGPQGRVEIAGPERMSLAEYVRHALVAAGDSRLVIEDERIDLTGIGAVRDALVPLGPARTGTTTLDAWAAGLGS